VELGKLLAGWRFFSWVIAPILASYILLPDFWTITGGVSNTTIFWTYFMGLLWGIGGLTFGLSMRYLGMSLGMAVALGYCAAFGTLIPQFIVILPAI